MFLVFKIKDNPHKAYLLAFIPLVYFFKVSNAGILKRGLLCVVDTIYVTSVRVTPWPGHYFNRNATLL